MKYSLIERETIINFNEAERMADIYTHNAKLINRLNGFLDNYAEAMTVKRREAGMLEVEVPKSWVKINPPRRMSDEQRQKLSARLKQMKRERN